MSLYFAYHPSLRGEQTPCPWITFLCTHTCTLSDLAWASRFCTGLWRKGQPKKFGFITGLDRGHNSWIRPSGFFLVVLLMECEVWGTRPGCADSTKIWWWALHGAFSGLIISVSEVGIQTKGWVEIALFIMKGHLNWDLAIWAAVVKTDWFVPIHQSNLQNLRFHLILSFPPFFPV